MDSISGTNITTLGALAASCLLHGGLAWWTFAPSSLDDVSPPRGKAAAVSFRTVRLRKSQPAPTETVEVPRPLPRKTAVAPSEVEPLAEAVARRTLARPTSFSEFVAPCPVEEAAESPPQVARAEPERPDEPVPQPTPRPVERTAEKLPDEIAPVRVEIDSLAQAASAATGAENDSPPRARYNPAPLYPAAAESTGREGDVLVRFELRADGSIASPRVERSSGYADFDAEALRTIALWRFVPAVRNGQPVGGSYFKNFRFRRAGNGGA